MPSDKRARQRANREQGRTQAEMAKKSAQRRRATLYYGVAGVLVILVVVIGALIVSSGGDDDDTDVATDTGSTAVLETTSTVAAETTTTVAADAPCTVAADRPSTFDAAPELTIDESKTYTATLSVEGGDVAGDIVIELSPDIAPLAVNNFVFLAQQGYYDCTQFHRIIPGFMDQGGDQTATGSGNPGYSFADEFPPESDCDDTGQQAEGADNAYPAGAVAMANSGPDTNGSQFFIVTGDASYLCSYSRFGTVTSGLDIAEAINALGSASGAPTVPVYLLTATITESSAG
jgi:cyclophilin family peptidyl-prolyl cis-trans isomerase